MKKLVLVPWLLVVSFAAPAQFSFTTNDGAITITGYSGTNPVVTIPGSTNGYPVTAIGNSAFAYSGLASVALPSSITLIGDYGFAGCLDLTNIALGSGVSSIGAFAFNDCISLSSVTLPDSLANIGDEAFANCSGLAAANFLGDAPGADSTVFLDDSVTVRYLPGTSGWGASFGGASTARWTLPFPLILTHNTSLGAHADGFGFTISWATNLAVVVDASTNLFPAAWQPVQTNTLTGGTNFFRDVRWTNFPARFYRVHGL